MPAVELEERSVLGALRRSGRLVRLEWLKVASLIVVGGTLAILLGPFVGAILILTTSIPISLLNVLAAVVYAVTMPFVGIVTAYVYFDARARDELAVEEKSDVLPAEIGLSASAVPELP